MDDSTKPLNSPVRLTSGIPGLDQVLNGGLFSGGMYVVVGDPGAGKTILANQFCFHHLQSGGRVVYITMLAETHARMFQYMQSLAFFDPAEIGVRIHYFSGFQWLRDGGLAALLAFLRGEIRSLQPTLLILDGLAMVTTLAETSTALRTFFHELQVFGEANGCTTLLLAHQSAAFPQAEYTLVDGIIVLASQAIGVRTIREIEVSKFRGSDYLQGKHHFRITNDGIQVDPRLESLLRYPSTLPAAPLGRVSTGVAEVDAMLHGGLFEATTTMIAGPSGSGKTLLGLHFLAHGAAQGINGAYLGFAETPPQIIAKGERVGLPLQSAVAGGLLHLRWVPPTEGNIDSVGALVLDLVRNQGVKRLVLDGVGGLQRLAMYPARLPAFFAALVNELQGLGVTSYLSVELPTSFVPAMQMPFGDVSVLMDNFVLLHSATVQGVRTRVFSIIKVRDSSYDPTLRELRIDDSGVHLAEPVSQHALMLDGLRALPVDPSNNEQVEREE